jgi:hypothetical protein
MDKVLTPKVRLVVYWVVAVAMAAAVITGVFTTTELSELTENIIGIVGVLTALMAALHVSK